MENLKLILENPNTETEIVLGYVSDENEANEMIDAIEEKWLTVVDANLERAPLEQITDDPVLLEWEGCDIYYVNANNESVYL